MISFIHGSIATTTTRRMLREIAAQQKAKSEAAPAVQSAELPSEATSVPQTVQDAPAESADAMPETAAPDNVREATAAVGETDSYENAPLRETLGGISLESSDSGT